MNILIQNWFRKVDIFPEVINDMPNGWAKRAWKVAYRDARQRAKIFCHSLDEIKEFRNFGVLKSIWAKSGNCIGRIRVDNLKEFDNNKIAAEIVFQDYAPNRIL